MSGGIVITAHDPRLDSDEEIEERVAFGAAMSKEVFPDDPPPDAAQAIAAQRQAPERVRRWSFRARDEAGAIVGMGSCRIDPEHDDNPDVLDVSVYVDPGHRRSGIATMLFSELVGVAAQEGRSRLLFTTFERVPAGAAAAGAVGATAKLVEHVNHLPTRAVDRAMLETWAAEGPTRAPGYELVSFDGPCPDEHLDGYIEQILVLNDAPRDDLQVNDFTMTPEQIREDERMTAAAGVEVWTLLARHESGAYAGIHNVSWNPTAPSVAWVGLTAVDPTHRGHALGKWLKATMTLRIVDERPDVTEIRTGNADSNDAMLGINRQMGYRPMMGVTAWELATDDARTWLDARAAVDGAGSPA
jgi:mycothiol synthase